MFEKFEPIVKKSIQSSLLELMTRSLSQEMTQAVEISKDSNALPEAGDTEELPEPEDSKIITTEEEIKAYEKIKAIAETSTGFDLEVQCKDTINYFGLNLGKTNWWFMRLYLSSQKKSFVTKIFIDEAQSLAPGFEVQDLSSSLGDATSKVMISDIGDLDKLAPLILRCYELEAAKH